MALRLSESPCCYKVALVVVEVVGKVALLKKKPHTTVVSAKAVDLLARHNKSAAPTSVEIREEEEEEEEEEAGTREFKSAVMKYFRKLDTDSDGFLVKDEIRKGMRGQ